MVLGLCHVSESSRRQVAGPLRLSFGQGMGLRTYAFIL